MKTFKELSQSELNEIMPLFVNWLGEYSDEAIAHVLPKMDKILNDETTLIMLEHLLKEDEYDKKQFKMNLGFALIGSEIEHYQHRWSTAKYYRKVLWDLYLKGYDTK